MALAKILLPVEAGTERTAACDLALRAAQIMSGRVEVMCATPDPLRLLKAAVGSDVHLWTADLVTQLEAGAEAKRARTRAAFDGWMRRRHLTAEPQLDADGWQPAIRWTEQSGDLVELIVQLGRFSELIVLDSVPGAHAGDVTALEAALFNAERPALIAPAAGTHRLDRCALVAWDGSREAQRAVTAALPMLSRTLQTVVLTIGAAEAADAVAETALLDWLACHGVFPVRRFVPLVDGAAGRCLLAEAASLQADLLVMGAYSHSRLKESVFGGITRHVLAHAEVPLLLAH